MANRTEVINRISQYRKLQEKFVLLCSSMANLLPPGNDYHIEIGSGDHISRNILVVGNSCRALFQVTSSSAHLGKIIFQRKVKAEEFKDMSVIYFDNLGNWKTNVTQDGWSYSFNNTDILNHMTVEILSGLLSSFD